MPGARCARSRAWCVVSTRVSHHGHAGTPGIPRAMVLTVSFVLSPVTGLVCHRHRRNDFHQLDTSVGVSGPHDFAVRFSAIRQRRIHVHRISRPTFCDDRETPLMRAEDARKHAGDLPDITSENVCGELARRANHARRRIPEHESQEPGHEPVIQCGRCMSALARIPDSNPTSREVRKVPISEVAARTTFKFKLAERPVSLA